MPKIIKSTMGLKKEEKPKRRFKLNALHYTLILIASFILINIYYPEKVAAFYHYLHFYFIQFLLWSLQLFDMGETVAAIYVLLAQIFAWLSAAFIFKVTIFNSFFPKIRIVTQTKDFYSVARKIKVTNGLDPNFVYIHVKFHLLPLISWNRLKIPKPEYTKRGIPFINRKTVRVKGGIKGIEWRRMPAHIDIHTNTLNLNFNFKENCYELGLKVDNYRPDPVEPYSQITFDNVQSVGTNIIESVKGDYGLIKGQFNMGIVIRERKLPGTEIPKKHSVLKNDDNEQNVT